MPVAPFSTPPAKNVYYLSISSVQKCIRRSDVLGALNFAKVAWQCDPKATMKRAWTWFVEDCGMNWEAACMLRQPFSTYDHLIKLTRCLAVGPKNRDSAHAGLLLGQSGLRRAAWTQLVNAKQREFAKLLAAYGSGGTDVFAELNLVRDGADVSWTLDLADASSRHCRDGFGLALPYFLSDIGKDVKPPVNECPPLTKFDGFLPLEAVDMHTRPGSAAMTATSTKLGWNAKQLGLTAFYCEGWLLRDMHAPLFPYWRLVLHLQNKLGLCSKVVAENFYAEVKSVLDDSRRWALAKTAGEDVRFLKTVYLDNWIGE